MGEIITSGASIVLPFREGIDINKDRIMENNLLSRLNSPKFSHRKRNFAYEMLGEMLVNDLGLYFHSVDVMNLGGKIAKVFGLNERETLFEYVTHDVGKTGVWSLLGNHDKYTDIEFERSKVHPVIGYEILKKEGFNSAANMALEHHMHQPNSYPKSEKGDPGWESGLLSLADFYSATFRNDGKKFDLSGKALMKSERPGLVNEIDALYDKGIFIETV